MSKYVDMENVLRYMDKSKDRVMQMTALRLAYEVENVVPESLSGVFDDDDILELSAELWGYICDTDRNHCSLVECDYLSFVRDIAIHELHEIHVLYEGTECGDEDAMEIWDKIRRLRNVL